MVDDILEAVDRLGTSPWGGTTYRHTAPGRDPLSGEGARLVGGRWNPAGRSCLYLADPLACCEAELARLLETQPGAVHFPRALVTVSVGDLELVDLTTDDALDALDLSPALIVGDDRSRCQQVGDAVARLGHPGLRAPSATGAGTVLAIYPANLTGQQLIVLDTTELEAPPPRTG